MADIETHFHETWLGMVQPIDGLVVSIPALNDAQCFERQPTSTQHRFQELLIEDRVDDIQAFLQEILGWDQDLYDTKIPDYLTLWIPEGRQLLEPTLALKNLHAKEGDPSHIALVWDVPHDLPLDRPEDITGPWLYPPNAKFERLLRHAKVPIGILTNRREFRLVYAPAGESSGTITFRVEDMATPGGRPILDAFIMLLSAQRFFGVSPDRQLPRILQESRTRQADITTDLAKQVYDALESLLDGFVAAADRDGWDALQKALAAAPDGDHVYNGLLTVLMRLVFLLYAEDRGLVPVDHPVYAQNLSVIGLFDELQSDAGEFPDTMDRRFGAWPRLLACFRAVYLGASFPGFHMPARRGRLFDPQLYPFLEGWSADTPAPIKLAEDRAAVRTPSISDATVFHVLQNLLILNGQRLSYQELGVEQIGSVYENLMGYHVLPKDGGGLELVEGEERKRTSSHYTPRSLTQDVVHTTLAPLIAAMGDEPTSNALLALKICDPAMGSGAFLVEACRYIADQVVIAWTREAAKDPESPQAHWMATHEDPVMKARRLVAQKCLYGVDRNRFAVDLAKLSMWLVTLARDQPFTFLDHALRHGDALVGLNPHQMRGFHWEPAEQYPFMAKELDDTMTEAMEFRQRILDLADTGEHEEREKEWLLESSNDVLEHARLLGDLVVGAWFKHSKDKDRKDELNRRLGKVQEWFLAGDTKTIPGELLAMQDEILAQFPVFHWHLEFPEIFHAKRPDPLDAGNINRAAYMDAFIANPPFGGKNSISDASGPEYIPFLQKLHPGAHGNADLSAHFFRRAASLLGTHGTMGMIATNTIAQGDTRSTGLQHLVVDDKFIIFNATTNMKWPVKGANVTVSVVHLAKGSPAKIISEDANTLRTVLQTDPNTLRFVPHLDDKAVPDINSRLRPKPERPDPVTLKANAGKSFVGTYVLGMGFTLTPEERDEYIAKDPKNAGRIFPYIGGQEVNSSPTQSHNRYVISFGQMSLEEVEQWPDLIGRVRELVKPERDKLPPKNSTNRQRSEYWWQFGAYPVGLFNALDGLKRCLVTARVSKHIMFSFQPTDRIYSDMLYCFPTESMAQLALLQSRVHSLWAVMLTSSMETRTRYSATDCFENFPFPEAPQMAPDSELEIVASTLYEMRAKVMEDRQIGLTTLYNMLTVPGDSPDPEITALIRTHELLDQTVLAAYGWSDIEVPPYPNPTTEEEQERLQAFEDEIIDRLFALNSQLAERERILGVYSATKVKVSKQKAMAKSAAQADMFSKTKNFAYEVAIKDAEQDGRLYPSINEPNPPPVPYASDRYKLPNLFEELKKGYSPTLIARNWGGNVRTVYRYLAWARWLGWVDKDNKLTAVGEDYLSDVEQRESLFRRAVEDHPLVKAAIHNAEVGKLPLREAFVRLLMSSLNLSRASAERRSTDMLRLTLEARQGDLEDYANQRAELRRAEVADLATSMLAVMTSQNPINRSDLYRELADPEWDQFNDAIELLHARSFLVPTSSNTLELSAQGSNETPADERFLVLVAEAIR